MASMAVFTALHAYFAIQLKHEQRLPCHVCREEYNMAFVAMFMVPENPAA